jgi:hypothetical protein
MAAVRIANNPAPHRLYGVFVIEENSIVAYSLFQTKCTKNEIRWLIAYARMPIALCVNAAPKEPNDRNSGAMAIGKEVCAGGASAINTTHDIALYANKCKIATPSALEFTRSLRRARYAAITAIFMIVNTYTIMVSDQNSMIIEKISQFKIMMPKRAIMFAAPIAQTVGVFAILSEANIRFNFSQYADITKKRASSFFENVFIGRLFAIFAHKIM